MHFEYQKQGKRIIVHNSSHGAHSADLILRVCACVLAFMPSHPAFATNTFCAVIEKTADGFVNLREGPGSQHKIVGKVLPSNLLWVATEQCRSDFGQELCDPTGRWVFVERVFSLTPAPSSPYKGWINNSLGSGLTT
jgi:hypothetical protein